jgi:hypothetical protein
MVAGSITQNALLTLWSVLRCHFQRDEDSYIIARRRSFTGFGFEITMQSQNQRSGNHVIAEFHLLRQV